MQFKIIDKNKEIELIIDSYKKINSSIMKWNKKQINYHSLLCFFIKIILFIIAKFYKIWQNKQLFN